MPFNVRVIVGLLAIPLAASISLPVRDTKCGVKGYRKNTESYFYDDSASLATAAACGSRCQVDSDCKSYAVGDGACQHFSVAVTGNFAASKASPYTFYDKSCASSTVCGLTGYDRDSPESFESSTAASRRNLSGCSALCKARSKCASFSYSAEGCQLYNAAVNGNFDAVTDSEYIFYDISCIASSSPSSVAAVSTSTPAASTTSKPATTTPTASVNYVTNGDFEAGISSWNVAGNSSGGFAHGSGGKDTHFYVNQVQDWYLDLWQPLKNLKAGTKVKCGLIYDYALDPTKVTGGMTMKVGGQLCAGVDFVKPLTSYTPIPDDGYITVTTDNPRLGIEAWMHTNATTDQAMAVYFDTITVKS